MAEELCSEAVCLETVSTVGSSTRKSALMRRGWSQMGTTVGWQRAWARKKDTFCKLHNREIGQAVQIYDSHPMGEPKEALGT